jgi:DNA-directed RNA polymerase subunit omega
MIERLKSDEVINKFGGRFKLASAIQKRWLELMQGARPLVNKPGATPLEIAIEELLDGRVEIVQGEGSSVAGAESSGSPL